MGESEKLKEILPKTNYKSVFVDYIGVPLDKIFRLKLFEDILFCKD